MPPKHGLGKGLDALLPDAEEERSEVAITEIRPKAGQPRQRFPEKELMELAYSIRLHGILQPLVVTPATPSEGGSGYELIAGERRLRAAKLAGLSHLPVFIRTVDEQSHYELALIENLQRADLSPVEEATAYRKLMTDFNLTQDELAKRLGKSRSKIAGILRLLNLPEPMLAALERGAITAGHASALLAQPGSAREELFRAVTEQHLSVRAAERWGSRRPKTARQPGIQPAWVRDLANQLSSEVEQRGSESRGQLILKYYSTEELNRLLEQLRRD